MKSRKQQNADDNSDEVLNVLTRILNNCMELSFNEKTSIETTVKFYLRMHEEIDIMRNKKEIFGIELFYEDDTKVISNKKCRAMISTLKDGKVINIVVFAPEEGEYKIKISYSPIKLKKIIAREDFEIKTEFNITTIKIKLLKGQTRLTLI